MRGKTRILEHTPPLPTVGEESGSLPRGGIAFHYEDSFGRSPLRCVMARRKRVKTTIRRRINRIGYKTRLVAIFYC